MRGLAHVLSPRIKLNAVGTGIFEISFHKSLSSSEQMETRKESTPIKTNGQSIYIVMPVNTNRK